MESNLQNVSVNETSEQLLLKEPELPKKINELFREITIDKDDEIIKWSLLNSFFSEFIKKLLELGESFYKDVHKISELFISKYKELINEKFNENLDFYFWDKEDKSVLFKKSSVIIDTYSWEMEYSKVTPIIDFASSLSYFLVLSFKYDEVSKSSNPGNKILVMCQSLFGTWFFGLNFYFEILSLTTKYKLNSKEFCKKTFIHINMISVLVLKYLHITDFYFNIKNAKVYWGDSKFLHIGDFPLRKYTTYIDKLKSANVIVQDNNQIIIEKYNESKSLLLDNVFKENSFYRSYLNDDKLFDVFGLGSTERFLQELAKYEIQLDELVVKWMSDRDARLKEAKSKLNIGTNAKSRLKYISSYRMFMLEYGKEYMSDILKQKRIIALIKSNLLVLKRKKKMVEQQLTSLESMPDRNEQLIQSAKKALDDIKIIINKKMVTLKNRKNSVNDATIIRKEREEQYNEYQKFINEYTNNDRYEMILLLIKEIESNVQQKKRKIFAVTTSYQKDDIKDPTFKFDIKDSKFVPGWYRTSFDINAYLNILKSMNSNHFFDLNDIVELMHFNDLESNETNDPVYKSTLTIVSSTMINKLTKIEAMFDSIKLLGLFSKSNNILQANKLLEISGQAKSYKENIPSQEEVEKMLNLVVNLTFSRMEKDYALIDMNITPYIDKITKLEIYYINNEQDRIFHFSTADGDINPLKWNDRLSELKDYSDDAIQACNRFAKIKCNYYTECNRLQRGQIFTVDQLSEYLESTIFRNIDLIEKEANLKEGLLNGLYNRAKSTIEKWFNTSRDNILDAYSDFEQTLEKLLKKEINNSVSLEDFEKEIDDEYKSVSSNLDKVLNEELKRIDKYIENSSDLGVSTNVGYNPSDIYDKAKELRLKYANFKDEKIGLKRLYMLFQGFISENPDVNSKKIYDIWNFLVSRSNYNDYTEKMDENFRKIEKIILDNSLSIDAKKIKIIQLLENLKQFIEDEYPEDSIDGLVRQMNIKINSIHNRMLAYIKVSLKHLASIDTTDYTNIKQKITLIDSLTTNNNLVEVITMLSDSIKSKYRINFLDYIDTDKYSKSVDLIKKYLSKPKLRRINDFKEVLSQWVICLQENYRDKKNIDLLSRLQDKYKNTYTALEFDVIVYKDLLNKGQLKGFDFMKTINKIMDNAKDIEGSINELKVNIASFIYGKVVTMEENVSDYKIFYYYKDVVQVVTIGVEVILEDEKIFKTGSEILSRKDFLAQVSLDEMYGDEKLLGKKQGRLLEIDIMDIDNTANINPNYKSVIFNTVEIELSTVHENEILQTRKEIELSKQNIDFMLNQINTKLNTKSLYVKFSMEVEFNVTDFVKDRSFDRTLVVDMKTAKAGDKISDKVKSLGSEIKQMVMDANINAVSNLLVSRWNRILFKMVDYVPIFNSMGKYIETPKILGRKSKYIINIKPETMYDEKCLAWCIIFKLYGKQIKKTIENYNSKHKKKLRFDNVNWLYIDYFHELGLDTFKYPINLMMLPAFENKFNLSINVWMLIIDNNQWSIWKVFSSRKSKNKILNLLLHNGHLMYITDISKFYVNNHRRYICDNCSHTFYSEIKQREHILMCTSDGNNIIYKIPKKCKVNFSNYKNKLPQYFVLYADFECIIKDNKHIPSGFYVKRICTNHKMKVLDEYCREFGYTGENCAENFVKMIEEEYLKLTILLKFKYVKCSSNIKDCNICWVCELEINEDKVIEHCHLTGEFRGMAHKACNNKLKKQFITIVFHGLGRYDIHLFIDKLFKSDIRIIAKSSEKYVCMTLRKKGRVNNKGENLLGNCNKNVYRRWPELKFIDSLNFLSSSLDSLSSLITDWKYVTNKDLQVKGIYPYEYMDDFIKFELTELPSIDKFKSKIKQTNITKEEYERAFSIFTKYCKTMKDYHDLYLKTDVLLLCEIFQCFREKCFRLYGLDPLYYVTLPGFAWDACLKFTKVDLSLLTDIDMYIFIQKGIRGGYSGVSYKNHLKINNCNEEIKYYDANNLYGYSMIQKLPYSDFEWISTDDNWQYNLNQYGYILEVDLEYPSNLHRLHNDFPLAPEHINGKLKTTLNDKKNYIIYYKTLLLYLDLGLKITKVHRLLRFKESDWLKDYIYMNFHLRKQSTNEFDKMFFKLMNNAVFGKTMQNVLKYRDFKLANEEKTIQKYSKNVLLSNFNHIGSSLVLMYLKKQNVTLNQPLYLGFAILDIAKMVMYNYHYNYFKKMTKCNLLYTDTDSLIYHFPEGLNNCFEIFDDYELGKLKDEMKGKRITEWIGLKSKCYSYKLSDGNEKSKNKGCEINLEFENYLNVLTTKDDLYDANHRIISKKHKLSTTYQEKKVLTIEDDKKVNLHGYLISFGYNF